jgi:hypothetical protein
MIPTMLDVLCHRAPYFNKNDYVARFLLRLLPHSTALPGSARTDASQASSRMEGMGRQESG